MQNVAIHKENYELSKFANSKLKISTIRRETLAAEKFGESCIGEIKVIMTRTLYVQLASSDSCLVLMQFHSRLIWTLEVSTVPSN